MGFSFLMSRLHFTRRFTSPGRGKRNWLRHLSERKKNPSVRERRNRSERGKDLPEKLEKVLVNEKKFQGEVFKVIEGGFKGWTVFKPTLESIPTSLPEPPYFHRTKVMQDEDWNEWNDFLVKNREAWWKKGFLNVYIEGDVFHPADTSACVKFMCYDLTDERIGFC
ncbi:hypothetical protein GOP47_0018343 [Adiantum capillus-veneris]|uniref:Uncharacterized protein n=1 Tax=Adiantum capillus-veneris TaxID=13818 RepID=A0A9D4UHB4_ADICA|nr:hypothetical protein GOP47_0018343 [Adiantum capillus-veneris]